MSTVIFRDVAFASWQRLIQQLLEGVSLLVACADRKLTEPGQALQERDQFLVGRQSLDSQSLQGPVAGKPLQIGRAEPTCVESQRPQVGEGGNMAYVTRGKARVLKGQLLDAGRAMQALQQYVLVVGKEKHDTFQVRQFPQSPEPWIGQIASEVEVSNLGGTSSVGQQFLDERRIGIDQAVDFASPKLVRLLRRPFVALSRQIAFAPIVDEALNTDGHKNSHYAKERHPSEPRCNVFA